MNLTSEHFRLTRRLELGAIKAENVLMRSQLARGAPKAAPEPKKCPCGKVIKGRKNSCDRRCANKFRFAAVAACLLLLLNGCTTPVPTPPLPIEAQVSAQVSAQLASIPASAPVIIPAKSITLAWSNDMAYYATPLWRTHVLASSDLQSWHEVFVGHTNRCTLLETNGCQFYRNYNGI